MEDSNKVIRILDLYNKLIDGELLNKHYEAEYYRVSEKSIQRDIDDIRKYLEQRMVSADGIHRAIVYDRINKGYRLEMEYDNRLTNSEGLALCKILLDSRAFTKAEMEGMLNKLIECCIPKRNQKRVQDLIRNEEFHYIEPCHKSVFIDKMWDIGQAIQESRYIEIQYQGLQGSSVKTRKLKPLAIMFSEYYFYMVAFIDDPHVKENFNVIDDAFPTIYRIDRIRGLRVLDECFKIPYSDRFEEGEFRKRIQFMFGGKLRKIRFEYTGYSAEPVLDRLPTAKIERESVSEDGKRNIYTVSAEVFGDGIDMWLRSQGDLINIL